MKKKLPNKKKEKDKEKKNKKFLRIGQNPKSVKITFA